MDEIALAAYFQRIEKDVRRIESELAHHLDSVFLAIKVMEKPINALEANSNFFTALQVLHRARLALGKTAMDLTNTPRQEVKE